ncbi:MAG: acetyl-CoA carboxylase biotin carboxyl carrier protein subunit [Desulfobacteraceae bacterium]|nr:MAG: acetyl-CoA carboxylase biotin carboxyl carrier protein subunit [Desulfobacteraceae bacterium]
MSRDIVAPMPGKIIEILVKEGDLLEEYQPVIILEAMKMENQISCEHAGRVKEIKVSLNDAVSMRQVLVVME